MTDRMEKIVALAKRRGFAFSGSEIYGGLANTWDFGPLGTLLKNNIRDFWWERFVTLRDDMVGVDASIFLSPRVWEASGHVTGFTDALIDCKNCRNRTRADHLIEDFFEKKGEKRKVEGLSIADLNEIVDVNSDLLCPLCSKHDWTPVRKFNLLFETALGIIEGEKSKVYLRGEIAQGIFLNFKNVLDSTRVRVPFGIAQQGKAFRNEITMGKFLHRTLEFDLMEFEYFISPANWGKVYEYWQGQMWSFAKDLGLSEEHLRWREHEELERSHYSKRTMDIEYHYDFGWKEMFGLAYRTDFDLVNHTKHSKIDLSYLDPETNEKYVPHVVEPTFGLSRLVGIVLYESYFEDKDRIVLKLSPRLAPYKIAVFPLVKNKPELVYKARNLYNHLKCDLKISTTWDDRGNIGKRYYAQDEAGTPWCVTVDYQTLDDGTVTVRDRDTALQVRMHTDKLEWYFKEKLS
jgi:glycyl-tRNA synthetase